ncbi:MAG: hypothetical protein NZ455_05070 [Bacteroidia bacterium]|nr:hypothetical protein [Bacteroidia bacterium]MDW8346441.1 hypothetical protein [Bacteroidia bacterium]
MALFSIGSIAQEKEETLFQHAFVFNVPKIHSVGSIGIDLQYQKQSQKYDLYAGFINFSFNAIKHPKELRYRSYLEESNTFILGKLNYFTILQTTVGIQRTLLTTSFLNQVNVHAGIGIGPSVGILTPYYLDIYITQVNGNPVTPYTVQEPFNPARHNTTNIYGSSGYFTGLNKSKLKAGLGTRIQIQADIEDGRHFVRGFMFGLQSDVFTKPIPMMYNAKQYQAFHGLFLGILLGSQW